MSRRAGRRIRPEIVVAALSAISVVLAATLPGLLSKQSVPEAAPWPPSGPLAATGQPASNEPDQSRNTSGLNIGGDNNGSMVVTIGPAAPDPALTQTSELAARARELEPAVRAVIHGQGLGAEITRFVGLLSDGDRALAAQDFAAAQRAYSAAHQCGSAVVERDRLRAAYLLERGATTAARADAHESAAGRWWPEEFAAADAGVASAVVAFEDGRFQEASTASRASSRTFSELAARARMVVRAEPRRIDIAVRFSRATKESTELVRLRAQARETAVQLAQHVIGRLTAEGAACTIQVELGEVLSFQQDGAGDWTMVWGFVGAVGP